MSSDGVCRECNRPLCQGQCACPGLSHDRPCKGCKSTPLERWTPDACDIVADMRARATPEGREAQRLAYREEAQARAMATENRTEWGETAAPVERLGVPHLTVRAARKPDVRGPVAAALHWFNVERGAKPAVALCGSTGIGKSVAAAHVLMKYGTLRPWWKNQPSGQSKPSALWVYAPQLQSLTMLRDDDDRLIEASLRCDFLVLDEVASEMADAGGRAFRALVAKRLDSGRLTVFTTNMSAEAFSEAMGVHVGSRLRAVASIPKFTSQDSRRGKS